MFIFFYFVFILYFKFTHTKTHVKLHGPTLGAFLNIVLGKLTMILRVELYYTDCLIPRQVCKNVLTKELFRWFVGQSYMYIINKSFKQKGVNTIIY